MTLSQISTQNIASLSQNTLQLERCHLTHTISMQRFKPNGKNKSHHHLPILLKTTPHDEIQSNSESVCKDFNTKAKLKATILPPSLKTSIPHDEIQSNQSKKDFNNKSKCSKIYQP